MPALQVIMAALVTGVLLWAFLVVAWYVFVPMMIIGLGLAGLRWGWMKIRAWQDSRATNGCTLRRTGRIRPKPDTVIDVDYTEVK